jgi:hypothetical protein
MKLRIRESAKLTITMTPGEKLALLRRAARAGTTAERLAQSLILTGIDRDAESERRQA